MIDLLKDLFLSIRNMSLARTCYEYYKLYKKVKPLKAALVLLVPSQRYTEVEFYHRLNIY